MKTDNIKVGDKIRVKLDGRLTWCRVIKVAKGSILAEAKYIGVTLAVTTDMIDMHDTLWPEQRVIENRKLVAENDKDSEDKAVNS